MSIKMMFSAMKVKTGSPAAKLVLIKLADNANDQGECWPSHETIADICEMSVKTSQRHVNKLVEAGLLSKKERKGPRGNLSNLYTLHLPDIEQDNSKKAQASNCRPDSEAQASNCPSGSVKLSPSGSVKLSPESVSLESVRESKDMSAPSGTDLMDKSKKSSTPYSKIHELYQKILVETGENNPRLVDVLVLDKERKSTIKSFWLLVGMDLGKVEKYFMWLWDNRESHTWIFGMNQRGWQGDIQYVCREKTLRKARENQLSNWDEAA